MLRPQLPGFHFGPEVRQWARGPPVGLAPRASCPPSFSPQALTPLAAVGQCYLHLSCWTPGWTQGWTLDPGPWTPGWTLDPGPWTLDPGPWTLG